MSARTTAGRSSAVVVGGGLAGITAALRLAEADHAVTLLETRPRLGGLAFSFRRGDLVVDNGQHVFLRCCTAYRGLIDRLGAGRLVDVQPRLDVPVLSVTADGRRTFGRLRRAGLPVPLHLAASLGGYPHLARCGYPPRLAARCSGTGSPARRSRPNVRRPSAVTLSTGTSSRGWTSTRRPAPSRSIRPR